MKNNRKGITIMKTDHRQTIESGGEEEVLKFESAKVLKLGRERLGRSVSKSY
jgi:hypothetical protein